VVKKTAPPPKPAAGKTKSRIAKPTVMASQKRSYVKQSDIPRIALTKAIRVAQAMYDSFAGKSAAPHQVAMAIDMTPTSKRWEALTGAALAYGLIEGGAQSSQITLTELGKRIVAPTQEGDDLLAKAEAVLKPRITHDFLERYNKAKFPPEKIALNVLVEMDVPQDRVKEVCDIILENGKAAGIIQPIATGLFVAIDTPVASEATVTPTNSDEPDIETAEELDEIVTPPTNGAKAPTTPAPVTTTNNRVFITHGKNKEIVNQLKELITFGKFVPIVAEEHQTLSKPVPDKVLSDMESCFAGIIHVASEETLLDSSGNQRHFINENVLIEIGAAMAFFRGNFILLVQKGLHLPSNLQGLYRCEYEGDKLDYEATMKLLKMFNEFTAPVGLKVKV
jgi:predicted nucleotide-binding protein